MGERVQERAWDARRYSGMDLNEGKRLSAEEAGQSERLLTFRLMAALYLDQDILNGKDA